MVKWPTFYKVVLNQNFAELFSLAFNCQHWFRQCVGIESATDYCTSQWWPRSLTHNAGGCPIIWQCLMILKTIFIALTMFFLNDWGNLMRHRAMPRVNLLRPRQNGRHFSEDICKCIFLNGNVWISIEISLKFISKGQINNIPALVQIMAWRRPGDKPLSEPMMIILLTHICVARPHKINSGSREIWNKI